MGKTRLDQYLVKEGYFSSREQAKRAVMAGEVFVNDVREDKAGTPVDEDKVKNVEVRGVKLPFVSRGGLKLQKALSVFPIDVTGCVCLDIGASTGGFTDCMLQAGAAKVYAVDVGYGQLDYRLLTDERVVSMERRNFRHMTPADFDTVFDFATADVSFISLDKILPVAATLLKPDAQMVTLIKPQFEAGRDKVMKNGVVKDKKVHEAVIMKVIDVSAQNGLYAAGLDFSPVTGPKGNIEYLLHLKKEVMSETVTDIGAVVDCAHSVLAEERKRGKE